MANRSLDYGSRPERNRLLDWLAVSVIWGIALFLLLVYLFARFILAGDPLL